MLLLLVLNDTGVNLECGAHLSTADFTVLHPAAERGLAGQTGRLGVLDLVLVDDHPHPVHGDVLLSNGDGLDVAVPTLDPSLNTFRQLPDVLEFLHGLSIVRSHHVGDTDLSWNVSLLQCRDSEYIDLTPPHT